MLSETKKKEINCAWNDSMIECLVEEEPDDPILTRWEILDL